MLGRVPPPVESALGGLIFTNIPSFYIIGAAGRYPINILVWGMLLSGIFFILDGTFRCAGTAGVTSRLAKLLTKLPQKSKMKHIEVRIEQMNE
jgi:hypothetical protein